MVEVNLAKLSLLDVIGFKTVVSVCHMVELNLVILSLLDVTGFKTVMSMLK